MTHTPYIIIRDAAGRATDHTTHGALCAWTVDALIDQYYTNRDAGDIESSQHLLAELTRRGIEV